MEHKTRTRENGTVHYWVAGSGENCIVFTHGATMDHGLFADQVDYFSKDYKVILWDVPMHGASRPYDNFSLQGAANALIDMLDAEQIEQAHLVGQSMGGYISQYAARDYPERVKSVTALDSSPLQPSYYYAMDNWLLALTPAILKVYPYNSLVKTIATQIAKTERAKAYALKTLKTYTKAEIIAIMDVVYQGVRDYAEEIVLSQPLLIIYGDGDRTGKVQTYSDKWAKNEDRPLVVLPDAWHNANMDNPETFNQVLDDFLRKIDIQ